MTPLKTLYLKGVFEISSDTLINIIISAVGIYLSVIIYTRISGKRSLSKISSFDFAMTVAVGSLIASTILSDSVNLIEGMFGVGSLYLFQFVVAILRRNSKIKKIVDNQPSFLMRNGELLRDNMKNARITESDIRSKIREANVAQLSEVKAVIFETTGNVVVIHKKEDVMIDDWLLKDVRE